MLHTHRRWHVTAVEPGDLVDKLHDHTWTTCQGFECPPASGVYWLNDSFGEASLQEFAVVRKVSGDHWEQVESITVSWCDRASLARYVHDLADTAAPAQFGPTDPPRLETPVQHGQCGYCR